MVPNRNADRVGTFSDLGGYRCNPPGELAILQYEYSKAETFGNSPSVFVFRANLASSGYLVYDSDIW